MSPTCSERVNRSKRWMAPVTKAAVAMPRSRVGVGGGVEGRGGVGRCEGEVPGPALKREWVLNL